jgi:hypothetical protein
MNWLAGRCDEMDRSADPLDAGPAADMTATRDSQTGPCTRSGRAKSRFQRLLKAPWRRLVAAEDLFPPALLALFALLPPPLGSLASALLAMLAIVIGLQVWHRYRTAAADAG